jgi:hypothetical protein
VNHWRLKLLGGSGKARKSESDAAEVVSLGCVCDSETLNKDRQSGETSARFLWKMTEVRGATSTSTALYTRCRLLAARRSACFDWLYRCGLDQIKAALHGVDDWQLTAISKVCRVVRRHNLRQSSSVKRMIVSSDLWDAIESDLSLFFWWQHRHFNYTLDVVFVSSILLYKANTCRFS